MYDFDYLEYDEYGLVKIGCMRCNKPVKVRGTKEVKTPGGMSVKAIAIKQMQDFKAVPFLLSDGSYTNILLCGGCATNMDSKKETEGITRQFRKGHELEAIQAKRSKEEIDRIKEAYNNLEVTKKHVKLGGK